MADAMGYVVDAMKNEAPIQDKLLCVSRLRVVALALGEEKTRSEMLPFLRKLRDPPLQEEVGDEVLTSVAEVLGGFEDFVGGPQHAHHLLDPLLSLCTIDETTVRSQAVDAINTLGEKLSPEQIFEHLAPKVMELFVSNEWFTPRVSACGLVAIAYSGCKRCKKDLQCTTHVGDKEKEKSWKPDELGKGLVEAYRKQFQDTEPMVRRSAALKLAEAATAFGDETTKAELVDVFSRLIEEQEQESIRVHALKSAPTIFRVASLTDADSEAGNKYRNCAIDKSWRVRVAVSESLPAVAHSRKANAQEIQTCQDTFMALLSDTEAEVRHATAALSAAAASVLGPQFAVRELVPAVKALVQDDGVANRVELAGVLLEMAGPIGMQLSKQVYLQPQAEGESGAGNTTLLESLMNDPNTNLRLAVISKLAALIDVLTIPQASEAIEIINTLINDKNWRIRHAAILLLPHLAAQMPPDEFNAKFISGDRTFPDLAMDNCALIRVDWILVLKAIGDVPGYGSEWLKPNILPALDKLTDQKNYQLKSVYLDAMKELGELIGAQALADNFLQHALSMVSDRVPNLRLMCAETLGKIAKGGDNGKPWMDAGVVNDKIKPALQKLSEDTDVDVRDMATQKLEALG